MQLDRIMEAEGFTNVEKALVKSPLLKNSERVKAIIDIKNARSNERQSEKIVHFTGALVVIAVLEIYANAILTGSNISFWTNLFMGVSIIFMLIGSTIIAHGKWKK